VTGLESEQDAEWAVALFERSVLKQAKFRQILAQLDDPGGKVGLDIGADNGVISYLLRRRGGEWHSADMDTRAVHSIRQLVGTNVHRLDGGRTPFPDGAFDQVVVVDFLEHIPNDQSFARELARIVKPGGRLVINVPHLIPGSLLNRLRDRIGLTDEWHGHLRPGYTVEGLRRLLEPAFKIESAVTYSRLFSELIDTALNGLYLRMHGGRAANSSKGTLITQSELGRHRKQFRLLSLLYPVFWAFARLDALLWFRPGYKLILSARRLADPMVHR
jgi:SAM-dependent methyltransferase